MQSDFPPRLEGKFYLTEGGSETEILYKWGFELPEFAMFTLTSAISSAAGGWLLDSTSLGISGIIWWMAALMMVPGILWFAWNLIGRSEQDHIG